MKIGNVEINTKLALAPMAGVCDLAFRTICREMGAGYTYTEMVSAKALEHNSGKTAELLQLAGGTAVTVADRGIGIEADVLKFHGNIELAPLVGMADRIVDITATGATLRQNNLVIVDEVLECTARFFANPASARTDARVFDLARRLGSAAAARRAHQQDSQRP